MMVAQSNDVLHNHAYTSLETQLEKQSAAYSPMSMISLLLTAHPKSKPRRNGSTTFVVAGRSHVRKSYEDTLALVSEDLRMEDGNMMPLHTSQSQQQNSTSINYLSSPLPPTPPWSIEKSDWDDYKEITKKGLQLAPAAWGKYGPDPPNLGNTP